MTMQKNFSFLMDKQGGWSVAPVYDLTYSAGPGGEHSTTIMGEGKTPTKEHLLKLAEKFSLPKTVAGQILDSVHSAISKLPVFADEAALSKVSKNLIAGVTNR